MVWISVSELPETGGYFIVSTKDGVGIAAYNRREGFNHIRLAGSIQPGAEANGEGTVTHWMPFPDKQKHADFLTSLTEEKIHHELEAGDKSSCVLFTNIVHSLIEIGAIYNASGVTLAYGRHNSSEFSDEDNVQMVMTIVQNSLNNWEKTSK